MLGCELISAVLTTCSARLQRGRVTPTGYTSGAIHKSWPWIMHPLAHSAAHTHHCFLILGLILEFEGGEGVASRDIIRKRRNAQKRRRNVRNSPPTLFTPSPLWKMDSMNPWVLPIGSSSHEELFPGSKIENRTDFRGFVLFSTQPPATPNKQATDWHWIAIMTALGTLEMMEEETTNTVGPREWTKWVGDAQKRLCSD